MNEAGIPVAAVRFPIELFDDEHAHSNGMFYDMNHPEAGTVRMVAPPIALDGQGFRPAAPTPRLGTETDAILSELGFCPEDINTLVENGIVCRDVF